MVSLTRPSVENTSPAIDPDAVYYRNPEARHKLRQYLASAQKFDEALTYGFPANYQQDRTQPYAPRIPSSTGHNDAKAYLQNEMISFVDHSESDPDLEESYDTSDNGTDSPATPADADFSWRSSKYNRVSIFGSLNTDSMPSLDLKFQPELLSPRVSTPAFPDPLLNREMTLRMTLTRPDLRANEDELYGWRKSTTHGDDPLALEQLPSPIEDTSGAHGAFAVPPPQPRHKQQQHKQLRQQKPVTQEKPQQEKQKSSSKRTSKVGFRDLFKMMRR